MTEAEKEEKKEKIRKVLEKYKDIYAYEDINLDDNGSCFISVPKGLSGDIDININKDWFTFDGWEVEDLETYIEMIEEINECLDE